MTFRLFNQLNEIFQDRNLEVVLRDYNDSGYFTVAHYTEYSEPYEVDEDMNKYPDAELFVFDGDEYIELELWSNK